MLYTAYGIWPLISYRYLAHLTLGILSIMKVPTTRWNVQAFVFASLCLNSVSQICAEPASSLLSGLWQGSPPLQRPYGSPWPAYFHCSTLLPMCPFLTSQCGFMLYLVSLGCWPPSSGECKLPKTGACFSVRTHLNGASCRVNTQGAFAGRRNMWLAQSVLAYLLSSVYTHTYIYTYICMCFFRIMNPHLTLWPCILCVFWSTVFIDTGLRLK